MYIVKKKRDDDDDDDDDVSLEAIHYIVIIETRDKPLIEEDIM